ncbi:MAG: hypothetical protein KatS3mg108_2163 [Isosphaeraceae bacterium]|jgi:hypothetical protein|nr:MAG: hypothetical protein KatS3mg108_2163 [Isosphaeraceae bacterium]
MPILFECPCGKRLKAREEIAGRKTRCPQCGRIHTVPIPEPKSAPDPPAQSGAPSEGVVLVLDDPLTGPVWIAVGAEAGPEAEGGAAPEAGLALDLVIEESGAADTAAPLPDLPTGPGTPSPPPVRDVELGVAAVEAGAAPTASTGVLPVLEPDLEDSTLRRRRRRLEPVEPAAGREPWYLGWTIGLARAVLMLALAASLAVPAVLLAGGLVALVQTGNPRTILGWRLGGVPVVAGLAAFWAAMTALALLWAGPALVLIDQSRRLRSLTGRLDELSRRIAGQDAEPIK